MLQSQASEEPLDPKVFAAESIEEIKSLIRTRIERSPDDLSYQRYYQFWLLLDQDADPQQMLELTADVDPESSSESTLTYHALALIRDGRHEEAAQLLDESVPKNPSIRRLAITVLATLPTDRAQAEGDLQKAEEKLNRGGETNLDDCILIYEAKTKLAAAESISD